ncbi:IgGFc-binding protein-like [Pezoporus wallicus]|uniref:IgGFc-binding protein-like n=1 Tax=Pezoporus wallicus TaxID=35540 RepID=UPI0025501129|nr:IgGFc-binding protein-like [Pezoporus wallicus]
MQNDEEGAYLNAQLLLTASSTATMVTVTTRGGAFTSTISLGTGDAVPLRLPGNVELVGTQLSDKAVLIQATKDISVVATSSKRLTTGATVVLPVEMLGRRYYAVTPEGTGRDGLKELVVVAGRTSTTVTIKAKGRFYYRGRNYSPGSILRVSLGPYHSFQLQSRSDLSGTEVTSDHPVAVLSGHSCVKVHTGCDHAVEQLLPVDGWGKVFVIPPSPVQKDMDLAYVVAAERTSLSYSRGNAVATEVLVAGQVRKVKVGPRSPLHLNASAGVQVVFFFTGSKKGSMKQDPFMVNIQPVPTYCKSYQVISMAGYENHIVLMAPNMDTSTVTLNQRMERIIPWQSIPGTDFSWATITMTRAGEIQSVQHPRTPFGLLVFGFQNYAGYGFSGLCATSSPPLSCQDLACKEKCEMVDGQPKCVQETFSTCWATGDPHYRTFDGKPFDFMGTCTYTLTKTCDPDPTMPIFSIEAKNEHRGNLKVSYVGSITIRVYGVTIVVVRSENGMVRVNNHRSHLPITLADGKLHLRQRGRSMLLQTAFKLKVLYDWDARVVLKLPSVLSGKVCGLCGNANGDPQDDALKPDGDVAQDAVELGASWKVANESHRCWDNCSGACERCQQDEVARYQEETWCGMMTQRMGPFWRCHATINPKVYVDNCIYDLCVNDGLHTMLCQALEAYADSCQEEGVTIEDWRTPARCPLPCPKNSNYTACGTSCPTTCNPAAMPPTCDPTACVETCECQEGFVLDLNECIPQDKCGCVFEGLLHGPHEVFWGDTNCTKRCRCDPELRRPLCQWSSCRHGEECRVEEGIQDCYPKSYGTCSAVGATHLETFDGESFTFQGSCLYQLAGLCEASQELVDFQVLVQNGHEEDALSSIALVMVEVYGKTIAVKREHPGKVMINDRLVNLPYHHREQKISISRGGQAAVVETDFGLTVTYDWQSQVLVSVPSTYSNALCGLCGNYNGNREDEMMMMAKNDSATSSPDTSGDHWKVMDIPGCMELSNMECPQRGQQQGEEDSEMGCGLLHQVEGPFGACHAHVDATKYFQSCVHDSCLFPHREEVACPILARYAAACQAAGVPIGMWRTEDFCNISCPPRSHYELCSEACSQTCSSIHTSRRCSMKAQCHEGCVCDQGFVLSGDECVPMSQCGCHHQDFYYKANETFYPSTQEKCHCQAGGTVDCQKTSCPGDGEGELIDGVFQCPSTAPGTCVATGDRSYVSFDGVAFNISSTCSYVLTETCSGDLDSFVVKVQKDARQKKKASSIQTLTIEVHGLTLTLMQGRRSVLVDSISHHLPAILSHGQVEVHQHGMGILLQTDFGLLVRYDLLHHVMVTVPPGYQGHLCGLCGNYNGQEDDDLLLPDGHQAPNTTVFGSAWKTLDAPCVDHCPEDHCPTCTEEKMVVLQKPNYCGLLMLPKGPFASCHHLIDPDPYLQACLHDVCLAEGDTSVLCRSIQSYSIACQDAGVTIEAWRRPALCPLKCPANSSYSLCTKLCTQSCSRLEDASRCPQGCMEGCQCDHGYVSDGHDCVPEEHCGCFVDGEYYRPHEVVLKETCQQRCTCVPGQGLTCSNHSCTEDEACEVKDGIMGCINQNPCKALRCRPKERCKLKDGQAKCVPSMVATCWAWGDPHYHTFDGLDFDFQGTCTYTMVESCGNDTSLVPFKVESKNDVRGGVKSISYVSLVNVKVYGQRISIHQKEVGKVRLDGVATLLPVTLETNKLRLFQSGLSAVVETDFGLRVTYDWNWRLLIDLPSSFYSHTCGLCGNFNLKPEDDVPQGGTNLTSVVAWAQAWKVLDEHEDDPFCWHYCEGACPLCEEEKRELYGGNQYCGLIKKSFQGPFKACHDVVPPQDFYRNCLYDVCMGDGAKQIFCPVVEAYASICKKHGATVHDWRTPSGCPLPCPENSHYDPCGTSCPATCADQDAPTACTQPCVETCACDRGYVLSGGQCVPLASCGCTHDGRYHPPGEEFWADERCSVRCRCDPALAMVVCEETACKPSETCSLVKGVRRCVAKSRSVCVATGDPHYTTFDGRRYDFMGTCAYRLVALCSEDPTLVPFAVTVENNNRGSPVVSYTKEVTLEVYNMSLGLSQEHPKKVKVNGVVVELPFQHTEKLQAHLSGFHGFITTDFGLTITFDWRSYARVFLPTSYSSAVCGLCGNANGDPEDDLALPNGHMAANETHFGDAWRVAPGPGCQPGSTEGFLGCTKGEKRVYSGDKHCGLLVKKRGPLAPCHGTIDPAPYWDDCLYDACVYEGHQEAVCSSIGAYVTACQSQGVHIGPWRTAAFCSPVCPPNQHYELCGPPCPATCTGGQEACEEPSPCTEGCFCDPGFLLSGPHCVPLSQCGCWHHGRYYRHGEDFMAQPQCSQRCRCRAGGAVECWPEACGADEVCEVQDGLLGCYPGACGRCEVLGGTFSTFDGHHLALGADCTGAMVEVDATEPMGAFKVEVAKEGDGIRSVVVTAHGVTVAMVGGRQWEVVVDGLQHLLPLVLADGAVTVSQEGTHRVLLTQGGPKVLFDGISYVLVTLPSSYHQLAPHCLPHG